MSELPNGWVLVQLGSLGTWGSGGTPKRTNDRYYATAGIPWLVIGDLNDRVVVKSANFITEQGLMDSSAKLLPTGTVLVAMYGSIGKLGITGMQCATNQAIAFCKPNDAIVGLRYLYHALFNAKPKLLALGQGGAQQNISQSVLKEFQVALAPRNEQTRIASQLDTLLARVQACNDRFDVIPALLKRFRQAVLTAATNGDLTAEWRSDPSMGNWIGCNIGQALNGKPRNGYSPQAVDYETPVRSLTLSATTKGKFLGRHSKFIDEPIAINSHLWLEPGDILIQRANSLEYVGVSAIFDGEEKQFIYPDLMMKCRPNDQVKNKFLFYALSAESTRTYFRDNATGTAGNMPKINQQTVMSAPLLLPPLEEQTEIIRRVEALFALADRIEARCATARTQAQRLTPLVLAKAFRGELVPQDPSDEPASVLLARIASSNIAVAVKNKRKVPVALI